MSEDVQTRCRHDEPWHDQEPGIVGHEGKVHPAQLGHPADDAVARGERPCDGGEAGLGDGPAGAVMDGVAHPRPDQAYVAQVMAAGDEPVPEHAVPGPAHHGADLQRLQVVETGLSREQRRFGLRPEYDRSGSGRLPPGWRQFDCPVRLPPLPGIRYLASGDPVHMNGSPDDISRSPLSVGAPGHHWPRTPPRRSVIAPSPAEHHPVHVCAHTGHTACVEPINGANDILAPPAATISNSAARLPDSAQQSNRGTTTKRHCLTVPDRFR